MEKVIVRFASGKTTEVAEDDLPRLRNIFPSLKVVNPVNALPDFKQYTMTVDNPANVVPDFKHYEEEGLILLKEPEEPVEAKKKVTKPRKRKK